MYVKWLQVSFKFFTVASVIVCSILIPINCAFGVTNGTSLGLHSLSIESIPAGHPALWVSAFVTSLLGLIACRFIWVQLNEYHRLRQVFFQELDQKDQIYARTLIVTDVPVALRDEKVFRKLLEGFYNAGVRSKNSLVVERVYIHRETKCLDNLITDREENLSSLEKSLVTLVKTVKKDMRDPHQNGVVTKTLWKAFKEKLSRKTKPYNNLHEIKTENNEVVGQSFTVDDVLKISLEQPTYALPSFSRLNIRRCSVIQYNSLQHYSEKVLSDDKVISEYREQHMAFYARKNKIADISDCPKYAASKKMAERFEQNFPAKSTIFVTFNTREDFQRVLCHEGKPKEIVTCSFQQAPEPRDILWHNLSASVKERSVRRIIVGSLVAALVIFYLVPVVVIIGFTDLEWISRHIPALSPWKDHIWARALTQTVLPTVLLTVCMVILQMILVLLSSLEKRITQSKFDTAVMTKYFYFELFNVLFAFTVGTSVFDLLTVTFSDPGSLLFKVAEQMTRNASFFVNYIILGVSVFAIEILQIKRVSCQYFRHWFAEDKTPRTEFEFKNRRIPLDYSTWYPVTMLGFVITIVYSTIYPIIVPFAALYFWFGHLIFRYQILYVYSPSYETGGQFFEVFTLNKMFLGMYIQQVTTFGVLASKFAYGAAFGISLPTLLLLIAFHLHCLKFRATSNQKCRAVFAKKENSVLEHDGSANFGSQSTMDLEKGSSEIIKSSQILDREYGEDYNPKTYVHPSFHKPLGELWLPTKTKDMLLELYRNQK